MSLDNLSHYKFVTKESYILLIFLVSLFGTVKGRAKLNCQRKSTLISMRRGTDAKFDADVMIFTRTKREKPYNS